MVLEVVFWTAAGFLIYTCIGYPVALKIVSLFFSRPVDKKPLMQKASLIICAYNEEKWIQGKLENCLALDYPFELEIIVASDGSTDGTDEIVKQYASRGVHLIRPFLDRQGKASVLNAAVLQAKGEILIFSDARQMLDKIAISELVANFSDPKVGAVSGELHLSSTHQTDTSRVVMFYWEYEKAIRKLESQVGSVPGVTGAIYAIRKRLYKPLTAGTLLDDVAVPIHIAMQGYRVVFDSKAVAYDQASTSLPKEWDRKVRTLAGNYQLIFNMPHLMNPMKNPIFFQFLSHKLFRLFVPYAMISLLLVNCFLTDGIYGWILLAQGLFYTLGGVGILVQRRRRGGGLTGMIYMAFTLGLSPVFGLVEFLRKKPVHIWKREGLTK